MCADSSDVRPVGAPPPAQVCVHSTLRHANDLGYQTLLLSDCVACIETPDVPALRETMLRSITIEGGIWGAIASSESLIRSLEG